MGWTDSKSTTSVSPQQAAATQTSLQYAQRAADQPFTQYQGPWHAGQNADQQQAATAIRNGSQVGAQGMYMAGDTMRSTMGTQATPVNAQSTADTGFMSKYFNPFLSQVAGGMVSDSERGRQMQVLADEDKALAANAYGGSRHGVRDAETARGFQDVLQKNLAGVYTSGFDRAAALGEGDANRNLSASTTNAGNNLAAANLRLAGANSLQGNAQAQRDNYFDWTDRLSQSGTQSQMDAQARIEADKAKFNEWRDYPMRQSEIINKAVHGMPQMGGTTTQGNSTLGAAGSLVGMAAMAKMAWPLLFASDENIKSNIHTRKGSGKKALAAIRKTPIKHWEYDPAKGGPSDGGRLHMGGMAQDIKRNLGLGDGHAVPIVDMIGANMAATQELADKIDRITIKRKGKK